MLISVVLPTHNRAALLERAVASARCQGYGEMEIVVVDDGSTDGTAAVLARLAAEDARVRVIRMDAAVGAARARNVGCAEARGALIAFLDDDDEWLPGKLEVQAAALAATGAGLVYGPYRYVDGRGAERTLGEVDVSGGAAARRLVCGNFIATPAVLVRRDLLAEVGGFDEHMPMLEDWELWLRLAAVTEFAFVDRVLVRVHHSAGGLTSRSDARAEACARIEATVSRVAGGDRAMAGDAAYALGVELMLGGAAEHGPAYLRRGVRLKPWPPQRVIMALLASLGPRPWQLAARAHAQLRAPVLVA